MAKNVSVYPKFKGEPFDRMLRRFRNSVERAGILKDLRKKDFFEKPSSIKHRKDQEQKRSNLNNKRKELAAEQRASMLRSVRR